LVFGDGYLGLGDTLMIYQLPMAESYMKYGVLYIHPEFYMYDSSIKLGIGVLNA
jgi:hypothetical protein